MAELIKVDRNGSKHWKGEIECDRCNGLGVYVTGVCNGEYVLAHPDNGVCWKCSGKGFVIGTWIERTPEYQAKLDAKRAAKLAAKEAERAAEEAKRAAEEAKREQERKEQEAKLEAERLAKEAALAAERAISKYVGSVGQRITVDVQYVGSPYFKRRPFNSWKSDDFEYVYLHTFKDESGNKIIWKTTSGIDLEEGSTVKVTGTIKEHSEYKGEKQTIIQRCKIAA